MATRGRLCLFSVLTLLLAGCAPIDTLNPLYTSKDIVFDEHLLGNYVGEKETDANSGLSIEKAGENSYQITVMDEGKKTLYDAYLVNLKDHHFLDVTASEYMAHPGPYRIHFERSKNSLKANPAFTLLENGVYLEFSSGPADSKGADVNMRVRVSHLLFRVSTDDKGLRLDYVDDSWFKTAIEKKTIQTPHLTINNQNSEELVWTASTQELQQFMLDHVNDDQVFSQSVRLRRVEKQQSAISTQHSARVRSD